MATSIKGLLETGRLGGRVRPGSAAFHRKQYTMEARTSMAEIISRYTDLLAKMKGVTPEVLLTALQPAFDKSQEYVPVRTGALKASGRLYISDNTPTRVKAVISYGNPSVKYTAIVHERIDIHHEAPTRAKFLQSAMEEEFDAMLATLAIHYAQAMT